MAPTRSSLLLNLQQSMEQGRWEEFVRIYRPLITHAVRRASIPCQDREDVIQSILLQLVKVMPSFSYQRTRGFFRSWLRRVATNQAMDWHRKTGRENNLLTGTSAIDDVAAAGDCEQEFDEELLQAALISVRPEFRQKTWECFQRRLLQQQTAAHTASELGLSENAVFINTSRVLSRIREFCHLHGEELQHDGHFQLVRSTN